MKTITFALNTKTVLRTAAFIFTLLSTTALPILINPPSAIAGTDTYPTSIDNCRLVGPPVGPYTNCDLKDSTKDTYYDKWNEENRECVSYVAWMLSSVNGFTMPFFGNATDWKSKAQNLNYTVDMNPKQGSIYWQQGTVTNPSGHVSYVESVSTDGTHVTTEDYNQANTGVWAEHPNILTSSAQGYIHFKDIGSPSWGGVGSATYTGGDGMASATTMLTNYYLTSANVQHALVFQIDGNLVLYSGNGSVLWQSGTGNQGATYLDMQSDGNLVIYKADHRTSVWQSGTGGNPGATAKLQSDGNFVVYSSTGSPLWWTGTGGHPNLTYYGSDRLLGSSQQYLIQNQYLRSADKRYALLMQTDGNVVLYGPGYHVLWQTATNSGDTFKMQSDGNLVLYAIGTPKWQSGTSGSNTYALMQSDGNFVVYSSTNFPLWYSGTGGQI